MSTGHANSVRDMLSRLETMVLAAEEVPLAAVRRQIASAIDIMVHLSRFRDRSRRVTEICEVAGCEFGEIELRTLFRFEEDAEDRKDGPAPDARAEPGRAVTGRLVKVGQLSRTRKLGFAGFGVPGENAQLKRGA